MLHIPVTRAFKDAICDAPPAVRVDNLDFDPEFSKNYVWEYLWVRGQIDFEPFILSNYRKKLSNPSFKSARNMIRLAVPNFRRKPTGESAEQSLEVFCGHHKHAILSQFAK
ncbi:MAG: hypothetical protein NVS9B14_10500 [Candidatus Acidiferrum sp.]